MKLSTTDITWNYVFSIVFEGEVITLSKNLTSEMQKNHQFFNLLAATEKIYGFNTGFGPMAPHDIQSGDHKKLQINLLLSHASGAGEYLNDTQVRSIMLARLLSLSKVRSGIDSQAAQLLTDFLNHGVYPLIPEHGGVGASGDLIQLAHLGVTLIGKGNARYKGNISSSASILKKLNLQPLSIKSREGLALINGVSGMTGLGVISIFQFRQLLNWMLLISAMLYEVVNVDADYINTNLHTTKKHPTQSQIAKHLRTLLKTSKRTSNTKNSKVQEYYSIRCVPQVLGPILNTFQQAADTILNEVNSVSDNPVFDHESKKMYHGGNFHGDYIATEMDKLKVAATKLSILSERQLNFLLNDNLNQVLPPFINLGTLGLNLGLQATQFTATSTVAENQTLSNPTTVHNIPSNKDNQDVVSMGSNAALLTQKVITNTYQVLSIELLALTYAVTYLDIYDSMSTQTKHHITQLTKITKPSAKDQMYDSQIKSIIEYMKNHSPDLIQL